MSTLLYRLRDTLCARREFLARKVGRRAVTRAEMICRSIFQGFLNAEKAQAEHSDEARKEWLLWAKDVCYDLIDVLEEMRLKEPKRAFSLLNLHTTGINKVKRIIYRLALLAAYAESLGLLRGGVQGQEEDGERTPFSGLEFLLIDGNKVGTGMLREALEAAVVVSSIVYENPPPEALRERSNTTWAESAQNHLIELFEELKKQQEAKTARGSRKIKRIVKELGTLIDEEAERMRLCPAPIQMENPAGLRATPSATSFAHHEIKFRGQRQTDREELVQKVVQQKEDESHNGGKTSKKGCEFIYVVGDVGMGKSAMARSVYSDENVTKKFPNRAWVDFSGKFDKRHLLKVIINRLTSDPTYEVETEALELRVRQVVKKKKCLVVLDNVQCGSGDDDEEDFSSDHMHEFLRKLFKDCDAVSRILITTREVKNVPSDEKSEANTITLDKLCEDDWVSIVKDCLFGLTIDETVRNEVIKHYDGKALTAKSISRIVRFKDSIPQGLKVLESYEGDRFALSYFVMPDSLRQCLLYCNLFPENQSIDVGKLIKLWMANDFAVSNPEDMERMGWGYIQQLLDHSVFQEFRRDGHGGSFKCKLEGEVINFIRRIAEDECHIMHLDSEKMARNKYGSVFPRHCTLNVASQSPLPKSIAYATELHTLIILSKYSSVDPTNLANLLSHMRRLRALGLSSCSIKKLPRSVGKMLHLRYLDLSFNHNLKKLPEAICDLLNLQSLNLNGCRRLQKLPEGIGKLTKLRHLEILWTTSLTYLPKGIASLTSLRTLSRFFGNSGLSSKACNLGDLGKLNQIKGSIIIDRLGDKTDASSAIKANLKGKKDLLGLELRFTVAGSESYHNDEKILQDLEAPPELQVLGIFYYRGESFPRWMMALDKLTHLLLADCNNCSDMPALGKLPSLVSLKIQNMSKVKEVGYGFLGIEPKKCDRGQEVSSFPKLEELCFQNMDNWEKWIGIANHAKIMPSLWSLSIINCRKIKENPLYIMAKKNLRYDITHCPILATNLGCRKPKTGWSTPIRYRQGRPNHFMKEDEHGPRESTDPSIKHPSHGMKENEGHLDNKPQTTLQKDERAVVHLVRDINARRLDWNLVVGVARMYQMPCQWVSSDAYTLELVLQDKEGDRIQCSIPHESVSIFESLIQENSIYSMCNFIVKDVRSGLRVTSHEYKLGFYEKTSVRRLPSDEFPFSPFRFTPFPVIEAMCSRNNIFLIDCMGQVVGREDPEDIITNTGQSSKRLRLYLEDGEKNKMKCTFFGDFVDQALRYLEQKDVEPLVIVAQLFKPHVYLSDVNVQASLYGSRVLFNPSFPAVVEFRDRLLTLGEEFTQPISHVESQGQRSVTDEISSGEFPLRTVEEVLNMTEPCSCWILASIVSIDGGRDGWFYASCKGCFKKVIPKNDLYHCGECGQHGNKPPLKYCLKVIVNDFTGCLNLLLWNPEGSLIVGKSATEVRAAGKTEKDSCHPKILEEIIEKKFLFKISVSGQNISSGDSFYSVSKISDDDAMIEQYSSQAALMEHGVVDQSLSNAVPVDVDVVVESEIDANGGAVVSLSKDSCTESNFESCLDTPIRGKGTVTSSKMGG